MSLTRKEEMGPSWTNITVIQTRNDRELQGTMIINFNRYDTVDICIL